MSLGDILASALSIVCAMVIFFLQRSQRKRDKNTEARAKARQDEARLMLSMIMANNKMSYATALAVKSGQVNGEMEEAMKDHLATKKEYYDFLNGFAMEQINKK